MTLDELLAAKKATEDKLVSEIAYILAEFEDKTGLTPQDVTVEMVEATRFGDTRARYLVSRVGLEIQL